MAHIIPIKKINQFLPKEKLELSSTLVDGQPADHHLVDDLEETGRGIILGKLSNEYHVEGWLETDGPYETPALVESILAMLVAGWVYDRQFASEVEDGLSYGGRKVREAYALLDRILAAEFVLEGAILIERDDDLPSTLITEPIFRMAERL